MSTDLSSGLAMSIIDGEVSLKVVTVSGSVYILNRATPETFDWNVARHGVDGRRSYHHAVRVRWAAESNDLRIGPWLTTGIKEVTVL